MNLADHYESYRNSVRRDALEDFAEYAKLLPTAEPTQWPTVHDYLVFSVKNILEAIAKNDEASYKKWLTYHKEAILSLFQEMVRDAVNKIPKDKEVALLDIIRDRGWKWYKFSTTLVEMCVPKNPEELKFAWVPRHGMFTQWPALDADELDLVLSTKSESWAQKALKLKESKCKILSWEPRGYTSVALQDLNNPVRVNDWTQELFPWEPRMISTAS